MLQSVGEWVIDISEDDDESTGDIDLRSVCLKAIQMPADWDAAAIAFFSHPWQTGSQDEKSVAHAGRNNTPQLALVLEATADQYRVLTENEQAMAAGLAWTSIQSIDAGDLPTITGVAQTGDRSLIPLGTPRG